MKIIITMNKTEIDETKNLFAAIFEENFPECKDETIENKIGKFSSTSTDQEVSVTMDFNTEFIADSCRMIKPFCGLIKSTYASFKGLIDMAIAKMRKYAEDDIDTIIKKSFPGKDNIIFTICKKKDWVEVKPDTKKLTDIYCTSLEIEDEEALKRAVEAYGNEAKFAIVKRVNGNNVKTKNPFKAIEWVNELHKVEKAK